MVCPVLPWNGRFALLLTVALLAACHEDKPSGARNPAVLDAMELTAARRVGLESASDALRERDLKRLKMLRVWVQERAQVVLFEPDDVESLDRAITCLETESLRSDERVALARVKSGALLQAAREVCAGEGE
jgi:hypothetical protein